MSYNLKINVVNLLKFIGKKPLHWLIINFILSFCLAFIEIMVAIFLQIFLINLGLLNSDVKLFGISVPNFDMINAIFFLLIIGFLRFIFQTIAGHSNYYILEYFNSRLKILSIYDLLYNNSNNNNCTSEINFKISEIFPKTTYFISNLVFLISNLIQCLFILGVLFFTSWKETILCLFSILFIGLLILKINKYVRAVAHEIPIEQKKLNQGIQKISRNIIFINIMRTMKYEYHTLVNNILSYSSKAIRTSILTIFSSTLPPFLGIILIIFVIHFSQNVWKTPSLVLISFIYLLVRFIQYLSSLTGYFSNINSNYPQLKIALNFYKNFSESTKNNVEDILQNLRFLGNNKYNEVNISQQNTFDSSDKNAIIPNIIFNKVTYNYPNSNHIIFKNISINISPGECVGIIGASGSGKSTLLLLLLGMIFPTKGNVLISDQNPKTFLEENKIRIGYVGAEPFLIKGTIKENLLYGIHNKVSDEEIYNALSMASLTQFIDKYSLDYIISEDHSGISAGQKQRICLARAVLNKPHLLVLDEASANLDEKTELEIAHSIEKMKGKTTIIIVSHRHGILKPVDKTINLDLF
ncbi:ATP-binding cassette domain-containing protein [Silvanigrella sp.]|jgi:ABC-type multidrug transport system fused ATPase/permease subunit|uniref:ATP-binding cassette domain-containing protein n=1 Tax=Silvanigrella sp. TaxID=2024976 RepID=UPI0037C67469